MRKRLLGNEQQGNLRNCTKLRNSLLGNGELASLAYGSFKELHKFVELFQGAGVVRGMFEAIWGSTKHGPTGSIATHPTDPRHSQGHIYWSGVDPGHSSVRSGGTNSNIPSSGAVVSMILGTRKSIGRMSIGIRISNCIRIRISSGAILRAISSARDTLIDGKSVGQASPHRLHLTECWGLVESRPPDELATGTCWANSGIEANYAHSLGAPKTCKSGTKSMCKRV